MDERNLHEYEPWERDSYETGSTKPPKNRGGLLSVLLVAVILLGSITSALGIMNIRLFRQLNENGENSASVSFNNGTEASVDPSQPLETSPTAPSGGVEVDIRPAPDGVENVPQAGGLSYQQIYDKAIGSVVSITCRMANSTSTGTGVVLSTEGYIVTNCHVVEGAQNISVLLTDNRKLQARLIGADAVSDLAVLYVDAGDLTPAEFGDSDSLRVGDAVAAIGDPLGPEFRGTMTDGIVSAINRDVDMDGRTMTLIQTNAALNSGNSGGPLINCYGQVIGINTMKIGAFTDSAGVEGIGFAIPSATVKDIVDQLISQGYVSGRPTLGLEGESLSTFYQHYYRLPAGLYITSVAPGSDAEVKGIEHGDMLLSVDDQRIVSMDELKSVLYDREVGETVKVVIYRSGQQYRLELTLGENKGS